jgi:hypothetical protein
MIKSWRYGSPIPAFNLQGGGHNVIHDVSASRKNTVIVYKELA